jgi:mono/diheme cytochrome c family protein
MNYPIWYRPGMGGGLMIAIIAIIHVFISHFAVGGGLYLVFAERKGLREGNAGILAFTRAHAKFFLLMTLVAGGMTGVAIWFIISLAQPAATSLLIHVFVFGWATEWVFFLVEIVAIFVYYYTFGRMDHRTHLAVGWIYFLAAWLSLFLINGIIDFMLTPGTWLADGSFWSGFFNPTFWPSLAFRTAVCGLLAGVYAFLTAAFLKDEATRKVMIRFSGLWVLGAYGGSLLTGFWYFQCLPAPARGLVTGASPTIHRALQAGFWALVAVAVLALAFTLARPSRLAKPVAFLVFISAFVFMGAFEWTREAARRPYVINDVMYSNSVLKSDLEALNQNGFLATAKWAGVKEANEGNLVEAGRELFIQQCYACHTLHGFNNDLAARTRTMTYPAALAYLKTIHDKRPFMPPFAGTEEEARALAAFIVKGIHGKELPAGPPTGGKGRALFEENCTACHDEALVKTRTAGWDRARVRAALDHLSALNPGMTEYEGTPGDKDLLADYVVALQGRSR